jgi:type VII secretion-associated serine protease mycosin
VLVSAAVAVLSVPAAQSASPAQPSRPAAAPADLYRGQQWTLDALHISRAWKYSRGNGVTVAVLDTGVDGHQPDLSGRVIDGPDFTGHTRTPGGRYWGRHGTEMASLIAGHGHGTGAAAGVMGVAPDSKILSIRVTWELNDPIRTDKAQVDRARDAVAKGIRYAADHGAQVISMSLGGGNLFYNGNTAEEAAIKYALGKGAVLIASAGNDGNGANRRNYPAAYQGVIAVGAVDRAFKAAKFTNRHTYISVAAPGVEIVSADAAGHGYILGTGTSSSAAFVAGMTALVKARYPSLTPPEVKQALEEGSTHRPPDGRSTEIGTGVADAYGALRTAARINKAEHGGAAVDNPQPTSQPSASKSKNGPDLLLIAVLSGGGTLIVLSLILGWRQRRRRPSDDDEDVPAESAALPVPTRSGSHSTELTLRERRPAAPPTPRRPSSPSGTSSGLSPWERRPPEASGEVSQWEAGPPEAPPPPPSSWERQRPSTPPPSDAWDRPPAESPPPASGWDRTPADSPPPASGWDRTPADSPPPASGWDRNPAESPPPASGWDRNPAESPPPGSGWNGAPAEPPTEAWDRPPAEPPTEAWDRLPAESPPPASGWDDPQAEPSPPSAWDDPQAETPRSDSASGARNIFGAMEPYESRDPHDSLDDSHRPLPSRESLESYESYDPAPRTQTNGNGSNGRRPPAPRDFRVAGGHEPDPLTDDQIDSSTDVGTPLADESWDSIRRGFDRLKDASNWESLAKGDLDDAKDLPASDAFDETASLPIIDPDEEGES